VGADVGVLGKDGGVAIGKCEGGSKSFA